MSRPWFQPGDRVVGKISGARGTVIKAFIHPLHKEEVIEVRVDGSTLAHNWLATDAVYVGDIGEGQGHESDENTGQ